MGPERAIPLVSPQLHFHAVRWLSAGPGPSAELGSYFSISIANSSCFPIRPGHTQATGGASEHCKDNLHSRGCKCGFQDPAAPGPPPESFIPQCYHHSRGYVSKNQGLWFPTNLVEKEGAWGDTTDCICDGGSAPQSCLMGPEGNGFHHYLCEVPGTEE